jgi:hypothetical protein
MIIASAINGYPALDWVGDVTNPTNMDLATNISSTTTTLFVVGAKTVDAATYVSTLRIDQYAATMRKNTTDKMGSFLLTADATCATNTVGVTPVVMEWAWRAANDVDMCINGTQETITTGSGYRAYGASSIGFGGGGLDQSGTKRMAEILCFTRVLSQPERRAVRRYLGQKYGIAVSPS